MLAQPMLALPRARPAPVRDARRPFHPSRAEGPYRLPHEVRDRLVAALASYRNREAAFALAVFLGRFWSMPGRVALPFPVDRRALAGRPDLGLTEARVRGAIRVLEEVGFLARFITSGSRYKATEDGLRRKPIPFQFGADYAPLFIAANRRAAAARGRQEGARRTLPPDAARGPSVASAGAPLKSPERKSEADPRVYSGDLVKRGTPPQASKPYAPLEAALERLRGAAGIAGDGSGKGGARWDSGTSPAETRLPEATVELTPFQHEIGEFAPEMDEIAMIHVIFLCYFGGIFALSCIAGGLVMLAVEKYSRRLMSREVDDEPALTKW
jgi:hypothetical protein